MDSSLIYFLLTDGSTADNGSSNKTTNSAFSDFWSLRTAYRALAKLIRCKTKKYFWINKGQLILKWFFVSVDFLQKTNENKST